MFECRTENWSVVLMEMKNVLYLKKSRELVLLPRTNFVKKNLKNKIQVSLEHQDIELKLKIRRDSNRDIGGWLGEKSQIEFSSHGERIDEKGACQVIRNF